MAIYNLSGNSLPPKVTSGSTLPHASSRALSTAKAETGNNLTEVRNVKQPTLVDLSKQQPEVKRPTKESDAASEIEKLQSFNQSIDRSLQFKVDEELGVTIVRVVDRQTDELIRQFPPEELINLSKRLKELNEEDTGKSGILLREKV